MVGKATFQQAQAKGNARIISGLNAANNAAGPNGAGGLRAAVLTAIGNRASFMSNTLFPAAKLGPGNTNATYAIGLVFHADLSQGMEAMVSGAKSVNAQESAFYEAMVTQAVVDCFAHFGQPIPAPQVYQRVTTESGEHSEMAVVGSIPKAQAKARMAVICFGKRVCAACGGLMNSYGIPHISILFANNLNAVDFQCDNATAGWKHPFSGSAYHHANNAVEGYQNPAGFSLSTIQPSRPGRFG